ncbi:MAG: transcriptional regulator [candidate division Zixibacteria bacterium CG_4_9_14_3_um_filter_46_8]|nr:MAG: transcriptional regulator [candidate division Zixibacteria bacterium CG_4_9_14_3_um_filter_46_8]
MNKRELAKFEKLLLEKRKQLIAEMEILHEQSSDTMKNSSGDLSSHTYHMADLGTDAQEREKSFLFASKSGRLLYHIDEALRRIKDNTFGKCITCGEEISNERLEAVPHARMCIKCKEKEEQNKSR